MAKRTTDSEKYRKHWFRGLPPLIKLFWDYLYHECNHAGIWIVDFDMARLLIGQEYDEEETYKALMKKVYPFEEGRKWFVPAYIKWHYNNNIYSPSSTITSARNILEKYDLLGVLEEYQKNDEFVDIPVSVPYKDPEKKKPSSKSGKSDKQIKMEENAADSYQFYGEKIKFGAKQDAINNIVKLFKSGMDKETIDACTYNYSRYIEAKQPSFYYQANNFFGLKAYYKDYLPDVFDISKMTEKPVGNKLAQELNNNG